MAAMNDDFARFASSNSSLACASSAVFIDLGKQPGVFHRQPSLNVDS
jgi:hypothetical protein